MSTRRHIWIDANRHIWNFSATSCMPIRFFEQNFQFRFGFNIEKENPPAATGRTSAAQRGRILQRIANLVPRLAHAGKHNPVPAHSQMPQMFQLAARNNVKPAPQFRELIQNRKIPIGLHGKTNRMRRFAKSTVQLRVSIRDRRPTI